MPWKECSAMQFVARRRADGGTLALGSGKRRLPEKKLRFGGSRIGGVLCSAQSSSQNGNSD